MLEATLTQADILKKIISAVSDLVQDGNFDCGTHGISLQAMDSSHVSLVSLLLRGQGFEEYRADRSISLGINLGSLQKILKCSDGKDALTLKADDKGETVQFVFESPEKDKISNFELKLMDIDAEHLGIPDTQYKCVIQLPSTEFQRICRDLATIGDTVVVSATKEGVKFAVNGDIGSGDMTLRHNQTVDKDSEEAVMIELEESVTQTFALRYLNYFTKATNLSKKVTLSMSPDVPLVVEYAIDDLGYVRYYLAPKIEDE